MTLIHHQCLARIQELMAAVPVRTMMLALPPPPEGGLVVEVVEGEIRMEIRQGMVLAAAVAAAMVMAAGAVVVALMVLLRVESEAWGEPPLFPVSTPGVAADREAITAPPAAAGLLEAQE